MSLILRNKNKIKWKKYTNFISQQESALITLKKKIIFAVSNISALSEKEVYWPVFFKNIIPAIHSFPPLQKRIKSLR